MNHKRLSNPPPAPNEELADAICASDLHFSHQPPAARAAELSWYGCMDRYIGQLNDLWNLHKKPPIFIAGDICHNWNEPAELINFLMRRIPPFIVIPGQHDLPHHNIEDFKRSALWTLIESGVVRYLKPNEPMEVAGMKFYGFPFGTDITPPPKDKGMLLHIAIIHVYIWTKKTGYNGAPEESRLSAWREKLKGYDIAVFGDNHNGFLSSSDTECTILNCGGFIRRRKDEKDYQPSVGLIYANGTVKRHFLDTTDDKFSTSKDIEKISSPNMEGFIEELESLGDKGTDFLLAVKHWLEANTVDEGVRKEILTAMEEKQ